jgi:hypothetical protein
MGQRGLSRECKDLFEKLMPTQLVKKFLAFMKPGGLSPSLQEFAIRHYHEPVQLTPKFYIMFLKD